MIFHIGSDVLGHIQGFLAHLLVDELMLLAFQALSFPGLEVTQGLVEIVQQALGKKAKDNENGDQGNYARHNSQEQDLVREFLKNRAA
jgi:hypothetical protein